MVEFVELQKRGAKVGDILTSKKGLSREPFASAPTRKWQTVEESPEVTDYDDLYIRCVGNDGNLGETRLVKTTENLWEEKGS